MIPIHDFGEVEGRLFIDMRLVDGVGLDQLIAAGPMDPRRAVKLIAQAAEALSDAHAHGVLHRDVKPSNMIVTSSDFLYLADFGIARAVDDDLTALTRSGTTVGTLAYMGPERFDGRPHDAGSDIYSLACTLAECLTGRRPFDAISLPSLMKAHLMADPPRPSRERQVVPRALDEVIALGMAKDPAARFAAARDLAAAAQFALQQWGPAQDAAQPASAVPVPTRTIVPPARRIRFGAFTLVLGAILLAAIAGGGGYALGHAAGRDEIRAAVASSDNGTTSTPQLVQDAAATSAAAPPPARLPITTRWQSWVALTVIAATGPSVG